VAVRHRRRNPSVARPPGLSHDRGVKLALGIVAVLATTAAAAPQTLRMQWRESSNVHLADQEGAISHRRSIAITVKLFDRGKLSVTDDGEEVDHNLYRDYSTTETTTWANRWVGKWSLANGALALELVLDKRTCTKAKDHGDGKRDKVPCDAVDRSVKLACKTVLVAVEDDAGKRSKVAAWQCTTDGELAETPATWTLGKRVCVRVASGRFGPDVFKPCAAD
jgi:hypothetical protein